MPAENAPRLEITGLKTHFTTHEGIERLLHLDVPYGLEPVPLFRNYAEDYGFTFLPIPVGVGEMQNQSVQWLQIRRENPDYVFMWGWGAMNPTAVSSAVST